MKKIFYIMLSALLLGSYAQAQDMPKGNRQASGKEAAKQAKDCLMKNGLLAADTQTGETQYYVSDSAESFAMLAEPIIGESVADCATQIDIDTY